MKGRHTTCSKMLDVMGKITCNGERAFALTWLVGEGLAFNLYSSWMDAYQSSNILLSYYQNPTSVAISDLAACIDTSSLIVPAFW